VADDSAAILTVETMRLWQKHRGLTRGQALQRAMRALRTGTRDDGTPLPGFDPTMAHPADWAPFTVIANTDE
jgi:CHAT domain-containing protein